MAGPVIALLTDFGAAGPYVGAVRGVLATLAPDARVLDISHDVPAHDVVSGAFVLAAARPWMPPGTIHLAVVDPGVGGPRRALAAGGGGQSFVGPDNGLFTLLHDQGVLTDVREIDADRLGLAPVSPTFHARDVFAPVAARLARGLPLLEVGPPAGAIVRAAIQPPRRDGGRLFTQALHADRFGNVTLNITAEDLRGFGVRPDAPALGLAADQGRPTPFAPTYSAGPHGRVFLLWGSAGWLEIAADRRSAAAMLGLKPGDPVELLVL